MTDQKKPRGRRGGDSIYWDKSKNQYVGSISLGYTPSGKRRRPTVYGKTKADVLDGLRDLRKELETGVKSSARYSVADAARDWMKGGLKGRSDSTVEVYRQLVDGHIIPGLGKCVLRELTADDVDDWLDTLTNHLASSVITRLLGTLRRIIRQAQRRDKVSRNVAELVDAPPGREGRPSKALTLKQARAIVSAARSSHLYGYIVVSLLTGIRTEEARAIRWEQVDLEGDANSDPPRPPSISVLRSVRATGDTKTKKSRRTLVLSPMAKHVLRTHRARQDQQRQRAGDKWKEHGLVFCTRVGTPYDPGNVRRMFRDVVINAGVNGDWTPRELRHSFTSLMSAHGVLVEDIARLLGHSTTATTEAVYRKELRPVLTAGSEALGSLFETEDP